jgi:hypothetical protein
MSERCFKEKNSNPPACGVHKVQLVQGRTPIDPLALSGVKRSSG